MSNRFLYVATVLIWGSTWIAIEFQLGTVAPEISVFYRYLLASALLYLTLFGSIAAFGSYLKLLGRIGAHKAGYAMVMFPVVALVISVLFEGLELSKSIVAGVTLVLAGNVFILRGRMPADRRVYSQPDTQPHASIHDPQSRLFHNAGSTKSSIAVRLESSRMISPKMLCRSSTDR